MHQEMKQYRIGAKINLKTYPNSNVPSSTRCKANLLICYSQNERSLNKLNLITKVTKKKMKMIMDAYLIMSENTYPIILHYYVWLREAIKPYPTTTIYLKTKNSSLLVLDTVRTTSQLSVVEEKQASIITSSEDCILSNFF